jgi:WD40 repeat protein
MFPWKYSVIHSLDYLPRQFEYSPHSDDIILFGTQDGNVSTICFGTQIVRSLGRFGNSSQDGILGLCWFRKNSQHFISGSAFGILRCGTISEDLETSIVEKYDTFRNLSSVHISCDDSKFIVSGNARDVVIYDIETKLKCHHIQDAHSDSINISRFSNYSPSIFATCSFDSTVKLWDLRAPLSRSTYTITCPKSLVMITFSPSDQFILTAGADNEVHQYLLADGRKYSSLAIPKRGSSLNFTRAYYSASGAYVLSGGSEENSLFLSSPADGEVIANIPLYPGSNFPAPYIQV